MKKIILVISLILLTGCGSINTAKTPVEQYLMSYQNLEYDVLSDIERVIEEENNLNDAQKSLYRDILKKQYSDLNYEITSEAYDGDFAIVSVDVHVYDYYTSGVSSQNYLDENLSEFFNDEGEYDVEIYMDYKLDNMKKLVDKRIYTIDFEVEKKNGVWQLLEISEENLKKIHGIYN